MVRAIIFYYKYSILDKSYVLTNQFEHKSIRPKACNFDFICNVLLKVILSNMFLTNLSTSYITTSLENFINDNVVNQQFSMNIVRSH
jgi:GTP-sensing pleiotropic transcriptional regulator CodY